MTSVESGCHGNNGDSRGSRGCKVGSRGAQIDRIEGCTVEIVLIPADEVGAPAQFSPGERVMGYVFCLLTKSFVCSEFKLKLKGEASCRFEMFAASDVDEEGESKSWRSAACAKSFIDTRQMTTHSNRETYMSSTYDILKEDLPKTAQTHKGNSDGQQMYSLEPGEYRFPFTFQLPRRIPPSFSAEEGRIAYNLSVLLSMPHQKGVIRLMTRCIQVVEQHKPANSRNSHIEDVALLSGGGDVCEPTLGAGGEIVEEAVIGCCMPDHLDLSVSWDKDAYSPGDVVLISSTLSTTAPKEVSVHGGYINLIQVVTFTAKDGEVKVKENSLCRRDFICHPLHKFPLPIPHNIPPSNMQHCSFISLKYIVRFKLYTEFTTMETKWTLKVGWPTLTQPPPHPQHTRVLDPPSPTHTPVHPDFPVRPNSIQIHERNQSNTYVEMQLSPVTLETPLNVPRWGPSAPVSPDGVGDYSPLRHSCRNSCYLESPTLSVISPPTYEEVVLETMASQSGSPMRLPPTSLSNQHYDCETHLSPNYVSTYHEAETMLRN